MPLLMLTTTTTSTIGDNNKSKNKSNDQFRATAEGEDEQVTTNGIDGQVYNGIPDWVSYLFENLFSLSATKTQMIAKVSEEETFEDNKALWWSPDSSRLVYGVFDDTNVDILLLPR